MARWAAPALCIATLAALPPGWAQVPGRSPDRVAAIDSSQSGAAPSPARPYEDRLIDGGRLAPLPSEAEEFSYDSAGLPRAWRLEGFASRIEQGGVTNRESGLAFGGRFDTMQYGAYTVDATLRNQTGSGSSLFTLWQRGLAFDEGWLANNGAGMMNTPSIDLGRRQFRFFLPTFPVLGAQTEWLNGGNNVQLQASAGEPGVYNGVRLPGFSRLGGKVFTGGAQWSPAPNVQVGVQVADARDVGASADSFGPVSSVTARSWFGAMAMQGPDGRVQLNLLDSETNSTRRHAVGFWLDSEARQGRYLHNFGVFRFDPGMFWGYAPVNSDAQGGYYRLSYQSQQWNWSGGLDSVSSVSDHGANGLFGTANVRYQVDQKLGVGGGVNARHSGNDAASAFAFVDRQSPLGVTRLQLDLASAGASTRSEQIAVDHAWPTQVGLRLSTSLSLGRERTPETNLKRASLALFGGIDLTNNLSIEGNVRWSAIRDSRRSVGTYANVGLVWRIDSRWSVLLTYNDNRSEQQTFLAVDSVISSPPPSLVPRDRAIFLTVRYEDRAGTPVAPLGGGPGAGAGSISGSIYYDANDDGRRSAGETGAANVTVVLDGRFMARTDSEGRFEFPLVAAGSHSIAVIPDNLALPYAIAGDTRRVVTISTRERTIVEIGATKLR